MKGKSFDWIIGNILFSALGCLAITVWGTTSDAPVRNELKEPMKLEDALSVLQSSKDPQQIEWAAASLVRIGSDSALDQLAGILSDQNFLNRWGKWEGVPLVATPGYRLGWILEDLAKLGTPKAEEVLLKLANAKEFMGVEEREEYLLQNLARMGTPKTCSEFEKHLVSEDGSLKKFMFPFYLMPVRNKPAVVDLYKRLLSSEIKDDGARNIVVQTLFDYRPIEWFNLLPHSPPPKREDASPEVLKKLLEIANMALKMEIKPETREGVLTAQKEIRGILQSKGAK